MKWNRLSSGLLTGALCTLIVACGSGDSVDSDASAGITDEDRDSIREDLLAELQSQFDKIDANAQAIDGNAAAIDGQNNALDEGADELSALETLLAQQEAMLEELQSLINGFVQALVPTRADAIATQINESWSDNEISINLGSNEDPEEFRHFQSTDGAGIIAYSQGDDGDEFGYLAFHDTTGPVVQAVLMDGGFEDDGAFDDIDTISVIWTPSGDAVIAMIAGESEDESVDGDVVSERVWLATFTRDLARVALAETGERYGFSRFKAIDTNVPGVDDNNVDTLFVASNLMQGTTEFATGNTTLGATGSRGDAEAPYIYVGWLNRDAANARRVEGQYIDPATLEPIGTPEAIVLPTLDGAESVDTTVYTSGRDLLLTHTDSGVSPAQQRMYLVRLEPDAPTVGIPIEISRGDNTLGSANTFNEIQLIGDGYRALNGQTATWVIYEGTNFENDTITQPDRDLVVAQISSDGTVAIDELDHNSATSAVGERVSDVQVQLNRGATAAYLYYTQIFDNSGGTPASDDSLFARALRLDGDKALADNVTPEVTINGSHDTDSNGDTHVREFAIAERDAFGGADANPNTSYVAYVQGIDGDSDSRALRARLIELTDPDAPSVALSLGTEETLVPDIDSGWGNTNELNVLQGSVATGEGLVFFKMNGNNVGENTAAGAYGEERPFVFASKLPGGQSINPPVQIGSDSGPGISDRFGLPAQFAQLEDEGELSSLVTPDTAAPRDFARSLDVAIPEQAVFVLNEYLGPEDSETGTTYRGRTLDLTGAQADIADRWNPPLANAPSLVGTDDGHEFEDIGYLTLQLLPEGTMSWCSTTPRRTTTTAATGSFS